MIFNPSDILPLLSGLVVLITALVKIIEILINFLIKKFKKTKSESELIKDVLEYLSSDKKSVLTDEEKYQLKTVFEIIKKSDDGGLPLCYFPRTFEHNQQELVHILNKLVAYEEKSSILLEYALDKISHLEEKLRNAK